MGMLLSESDKLVILFVAGILVFITFVVTTCLVSPWCYLYRIFVKPKNDKKGSSLNIVYPTFVNPESQHFHLSIVPVYGSKTQQPNTLSPTAAKNPWNQFENLSQLAEKARIRYSSLKCDNPKVLPIFPKVETRIKYKQVNDNTIYLVINIDRVFDLKQREYSTEPSVYVSVFLVGFKTQRKSIINKTTQNQLFRTETVKRSLNPVFNKNHFVTEHLPKCLLKEGSIKFRVIDEERYANDVCLGEVCIPLKKIECADVDEAPSKDNESENNTDCVPFDDANQEEPADQKASSIYTLFPIKEIKGEMFVGLCYLPTSKRVNITVVKANLRSFVITTTPGSSVHQAFYGRLLMFSNGKLIKKKKTSLSIRLLWGEEETVSFDLPEDVNQNISFMIVLSCKFQNSSSPTSPASPESPEAHSVEMKELPDESIEQTPSRNNSSGSVHKNLYVGHFVIDKETWQEATLRRPRKQILKWYKLY